MNPITEKHLDAAMDESAHDLPSPEVEAVQKLLKEVEEALRPPETLKRDFNASLRSALQAEVAAQARPVRHRAPRWLKLSLPIPLAAAVIVLGLMLWPVSFDDRRETSVAWADVVQAVQRVNQVHIILFQEDPGASDPDRRQMRLDWFYKHPAQWRAQGRGEVHFFNNGEKRIWGLKKGWLGPKENTLQLLADELTAQGQNVWLLDSMLKLLFNGKVPPGEPVKSDDVSSAQGIEVFDYARRPSERWVRIWVLRDSKLPLRMHIYEPGSDVFSLAEFDYTDAQPDEFFDPSKFEAAVKELGADDHRIYSIGSRLVAGTRPRDSSQIYQASGGYRAPKIRRLESNDSGDIALVTDGYRNVTPTGAPPHRQEFEIADNWGNRYLYVGGYWGTGEDSDSRNWWMPVPPMKHGEGIRKLTIQYVIEPEFGQPRQVIFSEGRDLPLASGTPNKADWPEDDFGTRKRHTYGRHLQQTGTLEQQLFEIEKALAKDPNDGFALQWKVQVLRRHDRNDQAMKLFESKLLSPTLKSVMGLEKFQYEMSQYLLHLVGQNRLEDYRSVAGKAQAIIDAAARSKKSEEKWTAQGLQREQSNPLRSAIHALAWRDAVKDEPKIVRAVRSRDGMVLVELRIPKTPEGWMAMGGGETPSGWFWDPQVAGDWKPAGRGVKLDERQLIVVYRGEGPSVKLFGSVTIVSDNYNTRVQASDVALKWERIITTPEPTVDDMVKWTSQEAAKGAMPAIRWYSGPPTTVPALSQVTQWQGQIAELRKAGNIQEALPIYEKIRSAGPEQWPGFATDPRNGPHLLSQLRRDVEIDLAGDLAKLGRFDESRAIAATLWGQLPATVDYMKPEQSYLAGDAMRAELALVRELTTRGDWRQAKAELDRIATHRPDLAAIPDVYLYVQRGAGRSSFTPRSNQRDYWRTFDTLWWEVQDRLASATTKPTE